MADPIKTDLESQVELWIKKNAKESSRLEFKLKVEIGTPGGKAEFIRDVIAMANSEGETPREDGHLVIGFKDGRFHDKGEHYDGATFGQILDSYICPAVNYAWKAFEVKGASIGVLVIRPDTEVVYVVNKKLQDENSRVLLSPGQSLGRKADRKIDLSGEAIHERLREIAERQLRKATDPLRKRIKHLERSSGPALEVKRIRFEMERVSGWDALDEYLDKLLPYAREFDGRGPHKLPIDPEAIDLTLCVRGVPLDAKAHRFLLRIAVGFALDTGVRTSYTVPAAGGRPEMTFPVDSAELKEQLIGKPPKASVRPAAWTIGRLFRNRPVLPDAERFYDPVAIPDSVQRAFDDLREFGRGERRPRVLVADPYALDERALHAIGAIAARFGSVACIDIATGFKAGDIDAPPTAGGLFSELWTVCRSWLPFGRVPLVTRRQEAERLAFSAAESVSKQLKVRFRFYRAEGLHDRFLGIGERLWHVGPSFNKIGEQISAIVEMTDERVKAQVLESLARFTGAPSVKETNP